MAPASRSSPGKNQRGALARPLDALVFLIPLIVFFELCASARHEQLIAFQLLRRFIEMFGQVGVWAPGLAVVVILLATHAASGEKWTVHWNQVAFMYVEATAMALPLLALNWMMPLAAAGLGGDGMVQRLATGVGAGIYEELVFRLMLISLVMIVGVNVLKFAKQPTAVAAVCLSSLVFAAHHHHPFGNDPFSVLPFLFRTVAGGYLAVLFWYRGYGPAAGCHAAYNAILVLLGAGTE